MHPRQVVPDPILRLALHQGGVVTREQVLGLELSRHVLTRLVSSGAWRRIADGVFSTMPAEPTWAALAWGGVLVGGPDARLAGEASGHLYGLVELAPLPVDVLIPARVSPRGRDPWRFIREAPGLRSSRTVGSPPRLTAEDTVLDLADIRSEGHVVALTVEALRRRLTTPARLSAALDGRARHRHRRLLSTLLADATGIESTLELDYLRRVERPHGLPAATRQTTSVDLPHRRDVEYDDYGVLVELDGRLGHEGAGRFRDMRRDNQHALRGALTLRYGWFDVRETPCLAAYQVYLALAERGYRDPFTRCRRCHSVPADKLRHLAA